MKRVRLGKTDMYVNAIGLGCMGLTHASGLPTPKEEAVEILRKAHDMGYDFYDTAECYTGVNPDGSTAYNEEVVGEAVKPFRKDEIINLLQLNDYSFEPLLSNEQLYLIGDIEEYQINLLINIIKHYKIIRNETQLYISYREI